MRPSGVTSWNSDGASTTRPSGVVVAASCAPASAEPPRARNSASVAGTSIRIRPRSTAAPHTCRTRGTARCAATATSRSRAEPAVPVTTSRPSRTVAVPGHAAAVVARAGVPADVQPPSTEATPDTPIQHAIRLLTGDREAQVTRSTVVRPRARSARLPRPPPVPRSVRPTRARRPLAARPRPGAAPAGRAAATLSPCTRRTAVRVPGTNRSRSACHHLFVVVAGLRPSTSTLEPTCDSASPRGSFDDLREPVEPLGPQPPSLPVELHVNVVTQERHQPLRVQQLPCLRDRHHSPPQPRRDRRDERLGRGHFVHSRRSRDTARPQQLLLQVVTVVEPHRRHRGEVDAPALAIAVPQLRSAHRQVPHPGQRDDGTSL